MRQLKITKLITNRTQSVERYFSEIEKEELITQEQEIELARLIKQGNKKAEEKLIKANLRFVISVAKKYSHSEIPLEDLISEGNIGLIKAAQKFDETRGFKFISYAVWWIRQSILEAYPTHVRSIRIPLNVQSIHDKIRKWSAEFEQKNQREPSVLEICDEFDVDKSNYSKMNSHFGGEHSLDNKMNENEEGTFADFLPSDTIDAYDIMETENRHTMIQKAMDLCLSKMEKQILCMYFGIDQERNDGLSNEEIGRRFTLSAERIRQIKENALKKLRRNYASKNILLDLK